MRRVSTWTYFCIATFLMTFFGAKWCTLSEFAMSCGHYQAAWSVNGRPNIVHVIVRNKAGSPLAGREIVVVSRSGDLVAITDQNGEANIHSVEGELVGLIISDIEIIKRQGLAFRTTELNLSNGLDVWATEMK